MTFLPNTATIENINKELVDAESFSRPYSQRQRNHDQREVIYESLWAKVNEYSKEVEVIHQRKKWITEETVQGVHKMIYEKKEEI